MVTILYCCTTFQIPTKSFLTDNYLITMVTPIEKKCKLTIIKVIGVFFKITICRQNHKASLCMKVCRQLLMNQIIFCYEFLTTRSSFTASSRSSWSYGLEAVPSSVAYKELRVVIALVFGPTMQFRLGLNALLLSHT